MQRRETAEWENDLHRGEAEERQKQLAEQERRHEEEIKQIREEERRKRCDRYVTSSNILIGKAHSLAKHRQNCPTQLLPAANETHKLIAEHVVAIVDTTVSTIAGAASISELLAAAPFTLGITVGVVVATGASTVAIEAGGGVGADKVQKKIKDAADARLTAQEWMVKDRHLCSDMLGGVIAYEESWNEMKEMFKGDHETSSMDAYLEKRLQQPVKVQNIFT